MKKIIIIALFATFLNQTAKSQNEGRLGIFSTISNTTLLNKDDKKQGDYIPTFKPGIGLSAGYHFTLFKAIPMGLTALVSYNGAGQNYNGKYEDSTSYWAYSRLQYFRMGASLQFGTNIRRQVALALNIGATYGFLTKYQERYELIAYDNSRAIFDLRNTDFIMKDTMSHSGSISSPLYKKTDLNVFGSLGLDFLINENIVFGFGVRMDMGMSGVENLNVNNKITFDGNPPIAYDFNQYDLKVKYRNNNDTTKRGQTVNNAFGVFLSLKYRIFNKDKTEFWYRERRFDTK